MQLYPKAYFKNVTYITKEFLEENHIKGLILDVDNTLLNYDKELLEGVAEWANKLKSQGIQLCIVSNSNQKEKVEKAANAIGKVWYTNLAWKPFKKGFLKAKKHFNLKNEEIAAVGDQIFTDVIGANRCKMFPILVEPIEEKDILITKIKRPIENLVVKSYLKKEEKKKIKIDKE